MTTPREPAPRRHLSPGKFLLGIFVAFVLLVGLCGLGIWQWWAKSARLVEAELARIREAGEPASAEELNARYATPPEGDVTELLLAAFLALDTPEFQQDARPLPLVGVENDEPIPPPGEPWADLEAVEALLTKYDPAMRQLEEAIDRGGAASYPKDYRQGLAMLLPDAQRSRNAARMLALKAHAQAHRGDAAGAAESIRGLFVLSGSLKDEANLISQLVRIAIASMGVELLQETLPHVDYSDDDLARLRQTLQEQDFQSGMTTALMGERIFGVQAMRDPASLEIEGAENLVFFGPRNADAAFFLELMRDTIDASKQPFPQAIREAEKVEGRLQETAGSTLQKLQHVMTMLLTPAFSAAFSATARALAARDAADAALAVEQYRRKHGALPESLEPLVPEFLPAVPTDPYDGQPLRYRLTDNGFLLYSVGRDGKDDGGQGSLSDDPDLVLTIESASP